MLWTRFSLTVAITLTGLILSTLSLASPLKIAVIDTGADLTHPFLADTFWKNPGESGRDNQGRPKESNGLDDDGNGYIDDVTGWNFVKNIPRVDDQHGHGTHIAGVIKEAATTSHTDFCIIPLKYYEKDDNRKNLKQRFFGALKYAIDVRADIINISAGGRMFDEEEKALVKKASDLGILIVAAAGNKSPRAKDFDFFPASYQLPNVFSVVATGNNGKVLDTSNMSPHKFHFYAPGDNIYSTLPGNSFGRKSGSSQAAAYFTGKLLNGIGKIKKQLNGPQYFAELKTFASAKIVSSQTTIH